MTYGFLYSPHTTRNPRMSKHSYQFKDHRILSKDEEHKLFTLYHTTESIVTKQRIKNTIVTHNMKFAAKCANTYIPKYPHVDPDDIKGYAMMGLIDTVDRFDPTRGIKFTSYAVWWIKNFINRNIETEESLIRHPANIHQQLQKAINNREFSDDILSMVHTVRGGQSLDKPLEQPDGMSNTKLGDLLEDESIEDMDELIECDKLKTRINAALDTLNDNEKFIIQEAYGFHSGEKRPLRDIANELNVTHDSVRYIRNKCITKLKRRLTIHE